MDEERIQGLCDLLLVGEFEGALKGNPEVGGSAFLHVKVRSWWWWWCIPYALEVHGTNLDHVSGLFALEDTVSASSRHACYVEQLCAIDHVII